MKFLAILLSLALLLIPTPSLYAVQRTVKLTTYYPAPYGEYKELKSTENATFATSSGNVGIGTPSPQAKLDVNGKAKMTAFQMSTGAQAGYVLTTDAAGNGVWQAASGGGGCYVSYSNTCLPGFTNKGSLGTYGYCACASYNMVREPGASCSATCTAYNPPVWGSYTHGTACLCCA